jgi:peptidoglycan/LPS O-acetylase OafA/YrhL
VSELRYRPDIDGLRAIAVLGVVLFHAGVQPLTGGFTGVDVFFVISGYLISSIIIKEIRRGDFSLTTFYERRIRRILPAFLVVVLFSAVLAYLLLLPRDFESFGKSLAAAGLSLSNILFWKESGYFDSSAELKPLLHTWSLGVEEQFYLFFPLLLLLISRFFKQRWVGWILAIAAVSFLLSIWGVRYQPSAAFYWLPTRAWELALGGLLAMGAIPLIQQRHWRELEGLLGLGLIAWGMFVLSPESAFPGANALFPCVGAAMVIHAGSGGSTMAGYLLSWRPLVLIGLISYSLYLWHWPLLVFAKYYLVRPLSVLETAGVIMVALIAATLSWHFVERPFRKHKARIDRRTVFVGGVAATAVVVSIGAWAVIKQGVPDRLPAEVVKLASGADDVSMSSRACMERNKRWKEGEGLCVIGEEGAKPSFVVLGDSHAGALMPGIALAAKEHGQAGLHAAMQSCPPLDGVANRNDETGRNCIRFREGIVKQIEAMPEIQKVVLIARWPVYAEGTRYGPDDSGPKPVLLDMSGTTSGNHAVFALGLERMVKRLRQAGKKVFLVFSVPEIGLNVPSRLAKQKLFNAEDEIRPTSQAFLERNKVVFEISKKLEVQYGVTVRYPHQLLCLEGRCSVIHEGRALYSDDDHMSESGAQFIRETFSSILKYCRDISLSCD